VYSCSVWTGIEGQFLQPATICQGLQSIAITDHRAGGRLLQCDVETMLEPNADGKGRWAGIPMRYRLRRVDGEPVPMNVLNEMELHPADPWKIRDRMLNEMGWCSKGTPWAEWKAALNRFCQEQGVTGKPGRITAATVRHGQRGGGHQRLRI